MKAKTSNAWKYFPWKRKKINHGSRIVAWYQDTGPLTVGRNLMCETDSLRSSEYSVLLGLYRENIGILMS
jgi:hypothetical protein